MTLIVPFRDKTNIEVRLVDNNRPRIGVGSSYPVTPLARISRKNFEALGKGNEDRADSLIKTTFGNAVSAVQNGRAPDASTALERLARKSVTKALHV